MSTFTRRPNKVQALQFDGTNGKEIVDFAQEHGATNISRGNGWVKLSNDAPSSVKLKKGDWVVFDSDGTFRRYDELKFAFHFDRYPKRRSK